MDPSDLLQGALLGSSQDRHETDGYERLGTPSPEVQRYREGFAGGADCPTESYCTFRGKAFEAPAHSVVNPSVAAWHAFVAKPSHSSLPPGWLDAAKTLVKGSRNPKDKTLLMAIQGYFVSQGALLLPLSTILETFGSHGETSLAKHLMTLCGAKALTGATQDGDEFSFYHHSTFFYKESLGRLKTFKNNASYGAWGVVAIKPPKNRDERLLGFITVVLESSTSQDRKFDESYLYGIRAQTSAGKKDAKETPWNVVGSVWNRVLAADPTGSKTLGYSKSALYIETLCASKSSVKNVGKLLLLWAMAWYVPLNLTGTYLELGFLGPALEPGQVLFPNDDNTDYLCAHLPSTYAASVYHQVFKYQRVFSLNDAALTSATTYIDSCVDAVAFKIVDGWMDLPASQKRQIKAVLKTRYQHEFHRNLSVFKPTFPSPYAHVFRAPRDPKFAADRANMVDHGSLALTHKAVDLVKEPHRFMRYFMYRPYPTEDHLRSIFSSIVFSSIVK